MKENLIIAYGDKNVTLNRNGEHFILTKEELAFIVSSALKNNEVTIEIK